MIVSRLAGARWETGRADMLYRDLIPDRLGGYAIASHIRIPGSGPVPDWVHFHRVRFQMIFAFTGWVRVVYEDQGPPFVLEAGDCVLQPPLIRHRVLESSDLEVVEVAVPSDHVTEADESMQLPTDSVRPERRFDGQTFARHRAAQAPWATWRHAGFEYRDTGISKATSGLADAVVARRCGSLDDESFEHGHRLWLGFVLKGSMVLEGEHNAPVSLGAGDSVALMAGTPHRIRETSSDLELLRVTA